MRNICVAIWGFGAMGSTMAKTLLKKQGVEVIGVCDMHPDRVGKKISQVLGVPLNGNPDVTISDNIDQVVLPGKCDICIIATDSFVKHMYEKAIQVMEKGVNVVTIAEEMAYPLAQEPELAKKLDEVAKKNGVSILGTGINPGLVMDLLAILLSACMTDVESVRCERVNSLSPFGPTVMQEQGIGMSVEAFQKGIADGSIAGHVGFAESVMMISDALGLGVDKFAQQMAPIVTNVDRKAPHGFAKAGEVAGVRMTGQGTKEGKVLVDMIHPQQIEPEMEGTQTGDYILLKGTPEVNMSIKPEISGGLGTVAMCVNCIPHVINAEPGLRTMIDIPVPHAIMGDFRNYVNPAKRVVKE